MLRGFRDRNGDRAGPVAASAILRVSDDTPGAAAKRYSPKRVPIRGRPQNQDRRYVPTWNLGSQTDFTVLIQPRYCASRAGTVGPHFADDASIEGTFTELACGDKSKIVPKTAGGSNRFIIEDPNKVVVRARGADRWT